MMKHVKSVLFNPKLKAAMVLILSASIIFAPHAGANINASRQHVTVEQITLSPGNTNSDELISDDQKKHRLHPAKGTVSSSSGQPVAMDSIKNALKESATIRRAAKTTVDQMDNLQALVGSDETKVNARVVFDSKNGTPRMIKIQGQTTMKRSSAITSKKLSVDAADDFLVSNKDLLKITTPHEEFKVKNKWTDALGSHHVRYQQQYQGMPVWGKEVMVHMDDSNQVYMFQGNYEPTPAADKVLKIDEQQAVNAALNHAGITHLSDDTVKNIEPVWYCRPNGQPIPVYAIEVKSTLIQQWVYFIDAVTGDVVHRISRVTNEIITSNGADLNGEDQIFTAWRRTDSSGDVLLDPTIPLDDAPHAPIPMQDSGDTYLFDLRNQESLENLYYYSGPQWDPTAVSMAYHIKRIDDYWKTTFNRSGVDGKHKNNILIAHWGEKMANAVWTGQLIIFGDGDDKDFSNLAGSLDVTAHEYAHGVVEFTAGLIYENQSGALNEAFADIFAAMVDRDDWTMGEDVTLTAPFFLRSLKNPADGLMPLPTKMSEYENMPVDQDHGGVHINCGIPARAAYLLAEGLGAENLGTSIGREKTEQIFYRALSVYLTQTAQFADAREATIQAATDLYGAEEAGSVQAAWDAVEVTGGGQTPTDPTPTDPITGDDIMVYLRPVDGTGEVFNLYQQQIPDPFNGYDPAQETGPLNKAVNVANRHLSVYTAEGETCIFYVGTDQNLYAIMPDGSERQMTMTRDIRSASFSPNGKYFVFTRESDTDHNIYVGDLETLEVSIYELVSPNTAPGDVGIINTIMYANSLSFDYTSSTLVFDTFNKMTIGSENDEYSYWSIGCLDLNTGQFSWPFPNQNPNYDIGNASFAYNNSFVIAIDVIDHSTDPATPWVWTMDLSTQTLNTVASSNPDGIHFDGLVCGMPSFWGNDDAITMQIFDAENGSMAYKVPLNNWQGIPAEAVRLNDHTVVSPVMHRVGNRNLVARINPDKDVCRFNGADGSQQVVISNSGNRDIRIYNIAITGSGEHFFRHDGVNGLLPRGQERIVNVFFEPDAASGGTQAATLVVHSDADTPMLEISLTGEADGNGGGSGGGSGGGGGGGGGCFISMTIP